LLQLRSFRLLAVELTEEAYS